ncbi:hypothetical protein [Massilia sp. TSP1-1-2]|uniref:hypothetical protein n=1 Tax=Massilia sp. TSP1-1-2 TaxID=2804649 RepID=UPI003CF358C2
MHMVAKLTLLAAAGTLAGCAGMLRTPPAIGDSLAVVTAKFGQPTARYPAPSGQVLEYATGPFGQATWMARMGPDGRLASFEQVLTGEIFATIKIGVATKADVLHTLGRPAERSYLALPDLEVWSYRYKESGVWNSMMHVHFDRGGIVRMMQNGPDPMYEEKRLFRD